MIKLKKGEWFLIFFNLIYILSFALYYISIRNYEFLWYVAIIIFFFILIIATFKKSKFDYIILWGLTIWGFLHMAGGGLIINGAVLYKLQLIHLCDIGDTYVLKFDQFVHAFGFAVTTLVAWHLIKPYLNKKVNYKIIYPLLFFIATGAGALNEIAEFVAVVVFEKTGVGGYYNTALDLVFNAIGSILAIIFIHIRRMKIKSALS